MVFMRIILKLVAALSLASIAVPPDTAFVRVAYSDSPVAPSDPPLVRTAGRHIRLITDLDAEQASRLTEAFDAAVPQWQSTYRLDQNQTNDFVVRAFVMVDRERFRRDGWLPDTLPPFAFGYALDDRVFVNRAESEYYTRHLLLHEGVHSLFLHVHRHTGPYWFAEGTAEWLATHRSGDDGLRIGIVPESPESAPYWARVTVLDRMKRDGELPSVGSVLSMPPTTEGNLNRYAPAWSMMRMLATYDDTRSIITKPSELTLDSLLRFNRMFTERHPGGRTLWSARWRVWCESVGYGMQPERHRTTLSIDDPAFDGSTFRRDVTADRGFQSVGVVFPAGTTIEIRAIGDCVLANQPKPWRSEPQGVSIRYVNDRPLGRLIAMVLPKRPDDAPVLPPAEIVSVGRGSTIRFDQPSWLLLRINDATGELDDNTGGYPVRIRKLP